MGTPGVPGRGARTRCLGSPLIRPPHRQEPQTDRHRARRGRRRSRVKYCTAADLVAAIYSGLADISVGRIIDTLLRYDLIIV